MYFKKFDRKSSKSNRSLPLRPSSQRGTPGVSTAVGKPLSHPRLSRASVQVVATLLIFWCGPARGQAGEESAPAESPPTSGTQASTSTNDPTRGQETPSLEGEPPPPPSSAPISSDETSEAQSSDEEHDDPPRDAAGTVPVRPYSTGEASPDSAPRKDAAQEESETKQQSVSSSATEARPSGSSWRLHALLGGMKAVSGHQSREYGFGIGGLAAVEWGPSTSWGLQAELGYLGLFGVDKQPPSGLSALGGATGIHVGAGLRVRPFAESRFANPKGLWLSATAGVEFTGGLVAPLLNAFLGYDFYVGPHFGLGPAAGYVLVLQTRDSPRPDNANLVLAGIHGTFDFGSKAPPVEQDRDRDGIIDRDDRCPDDPEDKDGFKDEDGCPEFDNDEDEIVDSVDQCPLDPEDRDQFEDDDGCPDPDNDRDGVPDTNDKCPLDAEDVDDFEDEDGCPDPDNDQDRFPDIKDLCPDEPEVYNGISDNDGCPDAESVRVVGDKIELDQKIHFWTNSDRIRAMSYPVLDKLGGFLLQHPEYVHVHIEGHADQRGEDALNLDLSQRRAESIKNFLIKRGLEESRLSFEGFGATRPLVQGTDEHSLFLNRRVEFIVTRNRKVTMDPTTGEVLGGDKGAPDVPAFGRDTEVPQEEIE